MGHEKQMLLTNLRFVELVLLVPWMSEQIQRWDVKLFENNSSYHCMGSPANNYYTSITQKFKLLSVVKLECMVLASTTSVLFHMSDFYFESTKFWHLTETSYVSYRTK